MRVVDAAALVAAAMLVSSTAAAQGIGDAAARERERRAKTGGNPAAQPVKVITEEHLLPPVKKSTWPERPLVETGAPTPGAAAVPGAALPGAAPASGTSDPAASGVPAATAEETAEKARQQEEEAQVKAEQQWRDDLERARKDKDAYQQTIDQLMAEMNDFRYGYNTPGMATRARDLEEKKQKLAELQGQIEQLEESGRRAGYR